MGHMLLAVTYDHFRTLVLAGVDCSVELKATVHSLRVVRACNFDKSSEF